MNLSIFVIFASFLWANIAFAQGAGPKQAPAAEAGDKKEAGEKKKDNKLDVKAMEAEDGVSKIKQHSAKFIKDVCQRYEGKYISYFGTYFHVRTCKRYELDAETVYKLTRDNIAFIEVESPVIQTIPRGGSYEKDILKTKDSSSLCKKFEHQYLTVSIDVYWIENCKKRLFTDWASYENHRGKLDASRAPLNFISWDDFLKIKEGKPMPSVVTAEYRQLPEIDRVDILPIDEACKGLIGQHVAYLGEIFYIEQVDNKKTLQCRRRLVDAEAYTKKRGLDKFTLLELSSSKAISIPVSP